MGDQQLRDEFERAAALRGPSADGFADVIVRAGALRRRRRIGLATVGALVSVSLAVTLIVSANSGRHVSNVVARDDGASSGRAASTASDQESTTSTVASSSDAESAAAVGPDSTETTAEPPWPTGGGKLAYAPGGIVDIGGGRSAYVAGVIVTMFGDGSDAVSFPSVTSNPSYLAWSPDHAMLAFTLGGDVWVANADGTDARRLALTPRTFRPVWSPDGSKLAFVAQISPDTNDLRVSVVDLDGTLVASSGPLSSVPTVAFNNWMDMTVAWSRAGDAVAFVADGALQVLDLTGAPERVVASPAGLLVGWGLGGQIAYQVLNDAANGGTFVVSPDGTDRAKLTNASGTSAWSPDGSVLAVAGDRTVHLFGPSGQVDVGDTGALYLVWSPDGTMFVAASQYGLRVMSTDGSVVFDVADGGAWQPPVWSPDGRLLLVDRRLCAPRARPTDTSCTPQGRSLLMSEVATGRVREIEHQSSDYPFAYDW
jgi:Tol biopolymer transport system component